MNTFEQRPATVEKIILTCCILHNLLRNRCPRLNVNLVDQEHPETHNVIPGAWRREPNLVNLEVLSGNTSSNAGKAARDYMMEYVNSDAGKVDWQERMI